MRFQPDQDYATVISGVSQSEDNDGNAELHIHCGEGESSLAYKLKWKTKQEVIRSRDALVLFGVDVRKLATSQAYVDGLPALLGGKNVYIRTKPWEMNGKSGVYIKQISPTPFEPVSKAIMGKMSRLLASEGNAAPAAAPVAAPSVIDDQDVPF